MHITNDEVKKYLDHVQWGSWKCYSTIESLQWWCRKKKYKLLFNVIQLVEKYRSMVHIEDLNQSKLICVFHALEKRVNVGNSTGLKQIKNNNITIKS